VLGNAHNHLRNKMELKSIWFLVFLTLATTFDAKFICSKSTYCTIILWAPWSDCSSGCGQGIRYRLPGMCCPEGVTVDTIFEECAVNVCNMTEREYNQTEVCRETDKCPTGITHNNCARSTVQNISIFKQMFYKCHVTGQSLPEGAAHKLTFTSVMI
jgi:hypothetical protein